VSEGLYPGVLLGICGWGELSSAPVLTRSSREVTTSSGRTCPVTLSQAKCRLMVNPSLDLLPKLVTKAFDTIKKINGEFRTRIILVGQKVHEVLKLAHRIYALRMGEVVFTGAPSELQSSEVMKSTGRRLPKGTGRSLRCLHVWTLCVDSAQHKSFDPALGRLVPTTTAGLSASFARVLIPL